MFENRTYRRCHHKAGLTAFEITVRETNLHIQADRDLSGAALQAVLDCRSMLESHIQNQPEFQSALEPVPVPVPVPDVIGQMAQAAQMAGTGPMAAVAGAVAQVTGTRLLADSRQVLVENGGDIFVRSLTPTLLSIHAGQSPLSDRVGLEIKKQALPYGVCTSSGTLGHSLSFGKADAAVVFADSCILADAVATALANRVLGPSDIEPALAWGRRIEPVRGMVIIKGEKIGAWGQDIRLVNL